MRGVTWNQFSLTCPFWNEIRCAQCSFSVSQSGHPGCMRTSPSTSRFPAPTRARPGSGGTPQGTSGILKCSEVIPDAISAFRARSAWRDSARVPTSGPLGVRRNWSKDGLSGIHAIESCQVSFGTGLRPYSRPFATLLHSSHSYQHGANSGQTSQSSNGMTSNATPWQSGLLCATTF